MLMYGTNDALSFLDNCIIYNLTSMNQRFKSLPLLIPPNNIGKFTGKEFDMAYAQWIMNNDPVFYQFFGAIIMELYNGHDIFLIVSSDDWSEDLVESLLKLIQQRYGYNACRVESLEDYNLFFHSNTGDFNPYFGIQNLDMDKERYSCLFATANQNALR